MSISPRQRPDRIEGTTTRVETGCGHCYVTLSVDEHGPCEVMARLGKPGGCAAAQLEAIGRLVSQSLRYGIPPEAIAKQLSGIRCQNVTEGKASCPDAVAQVLKGEPV